MCGGAHTSVACVIADSAGDAGAYLLRSAYPEAFRSSGGALVCLLLRLLRVVVTAAVAGLPGAGRDGLRARVREGTEGCGDARRAASALATCIAAKVRWRAQ